MKIARTRNAKRNLIWGVINKIITLVIPFVCRTAIIRVFGINYAGLNSLFTSILSALNLAELGFGSAIVFFMYKAIADEDEESICCLLNYFKRIYRIIGIIVLLAGVALIPFLKSLIHSDIPEDINLHVVYLLSLSSTVVSYFLFAYRGSILEAYQRKDLLVNINSVVQIAERILQLACIFGFRNYYLYLFATTICNILNNILVMIVVKKKYPSYIPRGGPSNELRKEIGIKIRGLFMYKIGNFISGSADSLVITAFLGLVLMGKYGNYYYVISTLFAFFAIYYSAIRAGIGNSIITESVEKNLLDFKAMQFLQNWIVSWCTICLLCLFQDFVTIYAGEENLLPLGIVICFCFYFWVWKIQDIVSVYKEASGLWNQDKIRPLLGAMVNLGLNLLLIRYIGLYGIILSTASVLLFIDIPWASKVLFENYFKIKQTSYFVMLGKAFLLMIVLCASTYGLCSFVVINNNLLRFLIKAIICTFFPNMVMLIIYRKNDLFLKSASWIKTMFFHKG